MRVSEAVAELPRPKRIHSVVCGLLLAASIVTPFTMKKAISESVEALLPLYARFSAMPDVWNVGVHLKTQTVTRSGEAKSTTRYLIVRANSKRKDLNIDNYADKLARESLNHWPAGVEVDYLVVELNTGVDLFLFHWTSKHNAVHSPNEWRIRLGIPTTNNS
jgi:hypothetical protein